MFARLWRLGAGKNVRSRVSIRGAPAAAQAPYAHRSPGSEPIQRAKLQHVQQMGSQSR